MTYGPRGYGPRLRVICGLVEPLGAQSKKSKQVLNSGAAKRDWVAAVAGRVRQPASLDTRLHVCYAKAHITCRDITYRENISP